MPKFNVGDTVICITGYGQRQPAEVQIVRVGRKYAYISRWGREVGFEIDTGVARSDYGIPDRIYTPAEWADLHHRAEVEKQIQELGVTFDWQSKCLSTATLEKILTAIKEDGQ